jgi:hypothetical protein
MLFLRFWRSALAWTAAMVALALASSIFTNFTGPYSHEPAVLLALFGRTLNYAARYLPVAAFAAGVSAARELATPRARLHLLFALASVGVAVFLLDAYLGPWLSHAGVLAFFDTTGAVFPEPLRPQTRPFLYSISLELAAQERGGPPPFNGLTMQFWHHLQVTAGLLGALMALLGVWAGRWTEGAGDRVRRAVQCWLAGLGLVAGVYGTYRLGGYLTTEAGVNPVLTASAVLVVPAVVLLAAAWTQWVASDRRAAGALAVPEPR